MVFIGLPDGNGKGVIRGVIGIGVDKGDGAVKGVVGVVVGVVLDGADDLPPPPPQPDKINGVNVNKSNKKINA
jgi:hypothetical protein